MALAANTVSPRPPLNLFEVERRQLRSNTWFQVLEAPSYYVPRNGPIAAKTVNTAVIMTGLTVTNIHNATISASARIKGVDGIYYTVVQNAPIPVSDFLSISFERQVMKTGEILEVSIPSNVSPTANHAHVHFSYIINQREEFTIL